MKNNLKPLTDKNAQLVTGGMGKFNGEKLKV